jgi:hypothetical protein
MRKKKKKNEGSPSFVSPLEATGARPADQGGRCVKRPAQASSIDVAPPPTSDVFGAFDGDLLFEEFEAGSELWSAAAFKFRQDLSLSCRLARSQLVLYPFNPEAVAPSSVLVTFGAGLVVVVGAVGGGDDLRGSTGGWRVCWLL